jgi:hypothetical protein
VAPCAEFPRVDVKVDAEEIIVRETQAAALVQVNSLRTATTGAGEGS